AGSVSAFTLEQPICTGGLSACLLIISGGQVLGASRPPSLASRDPLYSLDTVQYAGRAGIWVLTFLDRGTLSLARFDSVILCNGFHLEHSVLIGEEIDK